MEHFGRYELRRRLGVGGMAEVYEAVAFAEHGIEKPLVIKRILEEHSSDESFQQMFVDEARVAMRLNHPNVVQVFDFGKADDRYFLAMELVRGKDLAAIIARAKQQDRVIPVGVSLFIAGEVAKGLDHAHRLSGSDGKPFGIVHRDVSPQNVLISTEGAVKIGDFGIAKFNARADKTQVATVRGKVRYMSPEQADGDALDARSDLFSLAVVLYEMTTGTFAFDGRTDLDVLDQVRRCEPTPPSEITKIPSGLESILMRALSRDPKYRFARGLEFQRELESFAVDKGLRATSGALAEFLNSLFPEIESRNSAADGVTTILKLPEMPDGEKGGPEGRTRMRRLVADEGMPVFVSEEVRIGNDPVDTRESMIRRGEDAEDDGETTRQRRAPDEPAEETTQRPLTTGEVTATREASTPANEVTDAAYRLEEPTSTRPAAVPVPRAQARDAGTVVRSARASSADLRRPSEIATPPRGTPRPPPEGRPAVARPAPEPDTELAGSWPPPMRRPPESVTVPAARATAPNRPPPAAPPPSDPEPDSASGDLEPRARATFERAKVNPLIAQSLQERPRDPAYIRYGGIAGAALILGFFVFTVLKPYLPVLKGEDAGPKAREGALSVIGRTGDHVRVVDRIGQTVHSSSLPFSKVPVAPGVYSITVEGPFDDRKVTGSISVSAGETAIFDANRLAASASPENEPAPDGEGSNELAPLRRRPDIP